MKSESLRAKRPFGEKTTAEIFSNSRFSNETTQIPLIDVAYPLVPSVDQQLFSRRFRSRKRNHVDHSYFFEDPKVLGAF